jgi:hypothetical protein
MWLYVLGAVLIIFIIYALYEYRLRKPDHYILYEKAGEVGRRKGRYYPRHFSLALLGTLHSLSVKVEAEAKGKLGLQVVVVLSVAPAADFLSQLIRVGGWNEDAVAKAAKELQVVVYAAVRGYTELYSVEELSSAKLAVHLREELAKTSHALGLILVALNVQSIDSVDEEIAEAMHQQESSRILEQTENEKQKARIAATRVRIEADEKIAVSEHNLELKKYQLKQEREEKEAAIANLLVQEELKRREMQLGADKKELELLKQNPELLLLNPQFTRLAEASQTLRNARTVISLSPQEVNQGSHILGILQSFLQNLMPKDSKPSEKKSSAGEK